MDPALERIINTPPPMKTIPSFEEGFPTSRQPWIKLASGLGISIQASEFMYCQPQDNEGPYTAVEVAANQALPPLREYFDGGDDDDPTTDGLRVYAYVPVDVLDALVVSHGGIVEAEAVQA